MSYHSQKHIIAVLFGITDAFTWPFNIEGNVAKNKLPSGLSIVSIDHFLVEEILQGDSKQPIKEILQAHHLDTIDRRRAKSFIAIAELLKWYKYEQVLNRKDVRTFLTYSVFSPIFAYAFYNDDPTFLYLMLTIISLPICALGVLGLFVINKKKRFSDKIQAFCKHPFIYLIDDHLYENIPEMHHLEIEQQKINQRIQQSVEIENKIDVIHKQIEEKRQQIGTQNPTDIFDELKQEKKVQQNLREKAKSLLEDIGKKHQELKTLQVQIHNRADLEWLQNQARVLTGDRSTTFSQRALADLEVDTVDLHHRIEDLHHDLELAAKKWGT